MLLRLQCITLTMGHQGQKRKKEWEEITKDGLSCKMPMLLETDYYRSGSLTGSVCFVIRNKSLNLSAFYILYLIGLGDKYMNTWN